jgi:predicted transcriptional regulator
MKTTIELPDELIEQARRVARQERATLRALVEEGLQRSLEARRQAVRRQLDFPSYGGSGLTEEFQGVPWSRIRDEIYRERGA